MTSGFLLQNYRYKMKFATIEELSWQKNKNKWTIRKDRMEFPEASPNIGITSGNKNDCTISYEENSRISTDGYGSLFYVWVTLVKIEASLKNRRSKMSPFLESRSFSQGLES